MGDGSSWTEGEHVGITITEDDVEEVRPKGVNYLVGKIWTEKKINNEAFKAVMARVWHAVGCVEFREIQDNLWIFEFEDVDVKQRVMAG